MTRITEPSAPQINPSAPQINPSTPQISPREALGALPELTAPQTSPREVLGALPEPNYLKFSGRPNNPPRIKRLSEGEVERALKVNDQYLGKIKGLDERSHAVPQYSFEVSDHEIRSLQERWQRVYKEGSISLKKRMDAQCLLKESLLDKKAFKTSNEDLKARFSTLFNFLESALVANYLDYENREKLQAASEFFRRSVTGSDWLLFLDSEIQVLKEACNVALFYKAFRKKPVPSSLGDWKEQARACYSELLRDKEELGSLESLDLKGGGFTEIPSSILMLFPKIKSLNLENCLALKEDAFLGKASYLKNLEEIDLKITVVALRTCGRFIDLSEFKDLKIQETEGRRQKRGDLLSCC